MGWQKEISSYEKQITTLGRTLQALREETTVDGLVRAALAYLQTEFGYELVWLSLYDPIGHRLQGKGGVSPSHDASFLKQRVHLAPGDLLEQVVIQQQPLGVPDLRQETRIGEWAALAQKFNIQGTSIYPICSRDRCFGVVLLGSQRWGTSAKSEEKTCLSVVLLEMAAMLHQLDREEKQRQTKRPAESLLSLSDKLRSLPSLKRRLEAVIDETQRFIDPDRTTLYRTTIYWYEPDRRYFWPRAGAGARDQWAIGGKAGSLEIAVEEVSSFYRALCGDQLICVGEASASLRTGLTGRLMQQLQAQSLIAAPILFQGELIGFLAVEGNQSRIWTEMEKIYLRGAAHLMALTAPLEAMEETIQQVKLDQALTAELSHALYSEQDWQATLKKCAEQLYQRLRVERLIVLLWNTDRQRFTLAYQHQQGKRRPIATALAPISSVDWEMLERSSEAIAIENLAEDLKLMAWQSELLAVGVRSLLVCHTAIGKPLEALVLIGHEAPRSWSRVERELVCVISQQLGVLTHQLQLQQKTDRLQNNYQSLQRHLAVIQQIHRLDQLDRPFIRQMAQVMQVPLASLLTWKPGASEACLVEAVVSKPQFKVAAEATIPLTEPLLQMALATSEVLTVALEEVDRACRQWLIGPEIGQLLLLPLRTGPEHQPTAIVLLADRSDRKWDEHQLSLFSTLVGQFAWCRRYLVLTETLLAQRTSLQQLNWYKQRRFEEIYRILGIGVKRLNELTHQKDVLANLRYPQILSSLGSALSDVTPLLKQEQWQFHTYYETIPLAGLFKRALERVDGLIKQRQLWFQVHNEANLNLGGDIPKIEFILHEILTIACHRSPIGGRLDIWCRQADQKWLELSVTDNGAIDPQLLMDLEGQTVRDALFPSKLDQPPGLHLAICKSMMAQLGGELTLQQLEDQRILSCLVIPIAADAGLGRSNQLRRADTESI
jgi:GAF domain-containing protein